MSRAELPKPDRQPLIALVDRANRALQADMVQTAHRRGHPEVKPAHNSVFATLAEAVRGPPTWRPGRDHPAVDGGGDPGMVALGILEMRPDPEDRRAKLVTYTEHGRRVAGDGYQYLIELERRFVEEFGQEEYETARDRHRTPRGLAGRVGHRRGRSRLRVSAGRRRRTWRLG